MKFGQSAVLQQGISRRRRPFRYFNYLGVCLMASLTPDSCLRRGEKRVIRKSGGKSHLIHMHVGQKQLEYAVFKPSQRHCSRSRSREIGLRVAHKSVILMRVIKLQTAAVAFEFEVRILNSESLGSGGPIKCN